MVRAADDRRDENRPHDWLFDTLTRMEDSEQRHSNELRSQIAHVLVKLEAHITDDTAVQQAMRLDIQSLKQTRDEEAKSAMSRQTWLVSLTSLATAIAMWLVGLIFGHPR